MSLQHGILALVTLSTSNIPSNTEQLSNTVSTRNIVLLVVMYVMLGTLLRYFRTFSNMMYNLTPIYTTAVKVGPKL